MYSQDNAAVQKENERLRAAMKEILDELKKTKESSLTDLTKLPSFQRLLHVSRTSLVHYLQYINFIVLYKLADVTRDLMGLHHHHCKIIIEAPVI